MTGAAMTIDMELLSVIIEYVSRHIVLVCIVLS